LLGSLAILSGCGGGGGGGDDSASTTPSGLRVTVSDTYGAAVAGATVEATIGTSVVTETTGADGVALLIFSGATGTADVSVSRDTFITYTQPAAATVAANLVTDLPAITLVRKTSAAGGSLTSRSGVIPTVDSGKQTMTFEIELVIVGADSQPITGLTEGSFALEVCAPDPSNDRVDCVRGTATTSDVAYAPMTVPPQALTVVPGATAVPYAAALMLDQSGSIATSDPTAARLYSAKEFIGGLDASDRALLSAFTDSAAVIPDTPLTIYPPFRDLVTISSIAPAYFDTLDSLATLVGGGTPLYSALGELVAEVATDTSVFGLAKSVVIFTDGDDTTCGTPDACRLVRQTSISNANTEGIRIFTIGLTKQVNFEALGELANGTGGVFLFAESPEQLIPLYGSVGRLLSLSLPTYRLTWTVQATATDAFLPGNALLGNVTVTTGTSTFEVPFIVGIS
jgi:hypothetical protein